MFVWTEELATGNRFIDDQHKEIFRRAGELLELSCDGSRQEDVISLFKFLVTYVFEHFSSEEQLMRSHDYEGYEEHKEHHTEFLKKTAKVNAMLKENGVSEDFANELKMLIIELLVNHINEVDKKFAQSIQEQQ